MREHDRDQVLRALTRHQYVRDQGHPRVSTLIGDPAAGAAAWTEWLRRRDHDELGATTFVDANAAAPEGRPEVHDAWLDRAAALALANASEAPARPIAIVVDAARLEAWLAARHGRIATFVAEGAIEVAPSSARLDADGRAGRADATVVDRPLVRAARVRSTAEATMFAALEADAATRGRFQLNQPVSFAFGDRAAEVDLLSRGDEIAIEIDGYHHFTDTEHYRRDRRKDLLLQAHGYTVVRFLAEDVAADPRAAVAAVIELMGVRRGRAQRAQKS